MANKDRGRKPNNWFYSFAAGLLRLFYLPVYRLQVRGRENIPETGPVLLCSNHVAIKDPILIGIAQKRQVFYMAKEELFRNGFVGRILRALGAFPVKRGTGGGEALEEGERLLKQNAVVGVFIEGHRSQTGELQRPKTGAALLAYRTQATVVPVCITAQSGKAPLRFQKTLVTFGKPLPPQELAIENEGSLQLRRASRKVMERIAEMHRACREELGLPALPESSGAPGQRPGPSADGKG